MSLLQVIVLAVVQGLAELLPVSSSAHVVVAEKLMGLDPSSPQMTLLLVMLHTGIVGEALKKIIEKTLFRGAPTAEIEQLFSHLELIAPALATAGILILIAGLLEKRNQTG